MHRAVRFVRKNGVIWVPMCKTITVMAGVVEERHAQSVYISENGIKECECVSERKRGGRVSSAVWAEVK